MNHLSSNAAACSCLQLFINNAFVDAHGGATLQTLNPASGQALANVAAAQSQDVEAAVAAARQAFDTGPWPRMTGKVCDFCCTYVKLAYT